MKRLSYLVAVISILVSAIYSVRVGAIALAVALAMNAIPGVRSRRAIERIIPLLLIIALVTVALALPRR